MSFLLVGVVGVVGVDGVDGVAFNANGMPVAVDAPHSAIVTEFSKMNLIS
ncbi:hypothetical protein [Burkholderia contaminans]|nr:hypothetical protein [Burkholderia contaminans]